MISYAAEVCDRSGTHYIQLLVSWDNCWGDVTATGELERLRGRCQGYQSSLEGTGKLWLPLNSCGS